MEDLVPLDSITEFCDQQVQERIRTIVEAFLLEFFATDGVLVIGKALDTQKMPCPERVKQKTLFGTLPSRADTQRLRWLALQGQGKDGTTLGNVNMIPGAFVRRALVESLPRCWLKTVTDNSVVFEREEKRALTQT